MTRTRMKIYNNLSNARIASTSTVVVVVVNSSSSNVSDCGRKWRRRKKFMINPLFVLIPM